MKPSPQTRQVARTPSATSAGLPAIPSPRTLSELIEQSRQRCEEWGVSQSATIETAEHSQIKLEQERSQALIRYALPVMESMYEHIVDSQSTVILTNPSGFILQSIGDPDFLDRASRVALMPGVEWSEDNKGTNAIALALTSSRPVIVHGPQHYVAANHFLTCSASPILDPCGQILGVLDVSGDHRSYSPHTLALVRMSVRMLEKRMFMDFFPTGLVLHLHSRQEFLGTLNEGLLALSPDGKIIAADRAASAQLGISGDMIANLSFENLFGSSIRTVLDHILLKRTDHLELMSQAGTRLFVRIAAGPDMKSPMRVFSYPKAEERRPSSRPEAPPVAPDGRPAPPALDRLDTGDPQIHLVIQKVRRVIGRDIPLLIHGETGAGKELLARAIHDEGPRHDKPFMAVNCAAIPEGLIESELFGYEEGAFTGAKRRGCIGKIIQADGGTLFLDEIGDMPMPLQARLLRVLQERLVNPLGSIKAIPVDVHLICATHRRLKDWVADGKFREDLYYRLNGLTVNLPPLRQRNDLAQLVDLILAREAPAGIEPSVAPDVMEMFLRHPWPGNIRQLSNLLRTAMVMAEGDMPISLHHLPDDFLDEFEAQNAAAASAALTPPTAVAVVPVETAPAATIASAAVNLAGDLEAATLNLIQRTLEQHYGNVSAAARQLGVSRNTLYRKLKQIWQI